MKQGTFVQRHAMTLTLLAIWTFWLVAIAHGCGGGAGESSWPVGD